MKSPFRKLIRISVILFASILLFNFFGYYLVHLKSTQNEELVLAKSISGRQQTLSQSIAKDVALISGVIMNSGQVEILKDSLANSLTSFQQQEEFLQSQLDQSSSPLPEPMFRVKLLLSTSKPFYRSILAIGQEISQSDSSLLNMNRKMYIREMIYNEQKYLPLMKEITNQYTVFVSQKNKESSTIEIGKFLSLV